MKIRTHFIVTILLILFPLTAFTEEVYFYHTDNFGTPMVMTDINGEVVWRSDELPFGEEYGTIESPIKNNRRYLGKEMDEETGFIYMGSRYLNPATGQFNRPDPVGLVDPATGKVNQEMLLNPQRLNLYAYGLNNPYRFVDADGNSPVETDGTIALRKEASGVAARSIQRSRQFADFAVAVGSDGLIRGIVGRSGKAARLRGLGNNSKVSSADRGWITQETNAIKRKSINQSGNVKRHIRNPPGKDLAHERGKEAAKGFGYEHSNLQNRDLHKLQHKHDNYGRKNKIRN